MTGAAISGRRIAMTRLAIVAIVLVAWEVLAASGLLFRDVVPSLVAIGQALWRLLGNPDFYANLGITGAEIGMARAKEHEAELTQMLDAAKAARQKQTEKPPK